MKLCLVILTLISAGAMAAENPAMCLQCHKPGGFFSAPQISGQNREYLIKQLGFFKIKQRGFEPMNSIAESLSDQEIENLAAAFSARPWNNWNSNLDSQKIERGRQLVKSFSCTTCHGSDLLGFEHTPRIRGQEQKYLELQLRGFRSKERTTDLGLMFTIAKFLSDQDIEDLSHYLASLP